MATAEGAPPNLRPLRVGEILDVGIKVYTRNAKTLFMLVALVVIPIQVIGVLIMISTIPDALATGAYNPFNFDPNAPVPVIDPGEAGIYFAGSLAVLVLNIASTAVASAACFKAVSDAYLGETPTWRSSLRLTMKHFWPLVWMTILSFFGTFFGLFLCLLPGIWLAIVWSVATPALLTEDLSGTTALGRSFRLIQARFWPACGVLVIAYLIQIVLGSALGAGLVALTLTDIGQNMFLTQVLNGAAGAAAAIVATPFQAAVIAILYFDLRVRKEGFDLQLLAQKMGSPDPSSAHAALVPPPMPTAPVYPPGVPTPPGYQPGVPMPPVYGTPPASGLAIASLISSIVLCVGSIPAVIMGHMALERIKLSRGALGGRGLAIAGVIVGWVGIALLVLTVIGAISAQS